MQFKNQKIILLILGIWVVFSVTIFAGINLLIRSNTVQNVLFRRTGLNFKAQNLKTNFDINLNLNIKADKIDILNRENSIKFISLDNPEISIKPLSLLFKKAHIKKFDSNNILITITRDEKGEIDLVNALKINPSKFNTFQLTKLNSDIKNLELNYQDNFNIKSNTKLSVNDSSVKISKSKNIIIIKEKGIIETSVEGKKAELSDIDTDIVSDYKITSPNFKITLNNINLYLLSDFAKKYISKDIASLEGRADLSLESETHKFNLKITKPYLKLKDGRIIDPYKDIDLTSDFAVDKNKLILNDLSLLSDKLDINIKGEIIKPFSKKPEYELISEIKNTELNNFLYLIPDDLIFYRPNGIPSLKKSNFHGIINGKTTLKLFPLDITGNIKIENIHIPNYPKPYHQNDATLFFIKDKMRVYTRIYTPDNEYVTIDGVSNLDDSLYGKYNIKSTQKINLEFAQKYLVPVQQVIGFNIGPVPIMDIKGYGNIDIKTQGTIKDAQIFGQFRAHKASAKIHGLDAELNNGECNLIFDNRNLIFKEIKGSLDNGSFILTGIGNTKGEVDLSAKISDIALSRMIKLFNNSVLTNDYTSLLKNISASSGIMSTQLNLKGTIKDYEKEDFLNTLNLSGNFELKNNKIILNNGLSAKNIKGTLNFDDSASQNGNFEFDINSSKFNTSFDIKQGMREIANNAPFNINLIISSQKCALSDIFEGIKKYKALNQKAIGFINDISNIDFYSKINLNISGTTSFNNFNFGDLKTKGYIAGLNSAQNKNVHFENGLIRIDNNNVIFDDFKANISEGSIQAKGSTDNGLKVSLKNLHLDKFDKLIPKTKLENTIIKSGEISVHKNDLKLNAINIDYNNMPVILNLSTKLNSDNGNFSADLSTILNETTTDYAINPYLSYPIKIKNGEIPLNAKVSGNIQNFNIDFTTKIPREADIYFSGANIGDTEQEREISGKININKDILTLNNLRLIKYIKNQNNKTNPITAISLNGKLNKKIDGLYFDNFKIATQNPINVRILNLIFKKSLLKKGNFECNVNLSGKSSSPLITGKIDLQDLDIPLYDTQINNIKINITQNNIYTAITAKNGESDLKADIYAVNNLKAPYIINKVNIESNKLNIHDILASLPSPNNKTDIVKKQDFTIKPQDIIIKEGNFSFNDVTFNKISAQNLKGKFSYKDNLFDMKNIAFDIAKGEVSGKGSYSLNSTKLKLQADMKDCDSNILAKDFLNISGQIFGKMTGTIDLTAKDLNSPDNIKNVDSSVNFTIDNGKMPKLGSLEYLLRAGNLLKNGVLGLSLNNLIQVLTPYKTGEFEKITGSMKMSEGEIKELKILSKGKNLSMYLLGEYKILEDFADIQIYGRLSQNVSNALGSLGNASIKQFLSTFTRKKDTQRSQELQEYLDKVPLVDNSDQGGYFSAKVYGDINKDNYVKKFNWE